MALVLRLSGSRAAAFWSGALYSVLSPSGWLDALNEIWRPGRLRDLVAWGEGPHVSSLTMLPVALLLLDLALDRTRSRTRVRLIVFATLGFAAVALTNVIGSVALALGVAAYLFARGNWRDAGLTVAIGVTAYCLSMPWIPPSTIATIRDNAKYMGADYSMAYRTLPLWIAAALLILGLLKVIARRRPIAIQFALFFAFLTALPPLLDVRGIPKFFRSPSGIIEMEMGLAILAGLTIDAVMKLAPRRNAWLVTGALALALVFPLRADRRFARGYLIQSVDITTTSEWKTAQWLNRNWTGGRVMLPGSSSFWLTAFSDTPELGGGVDQGSILPVIPMAKYQVWTGDGAGAGGSRDRCPLVEGSRGRRRGREPARNWKSTRISRIPINSTASSNPCGAMVATYHVA